MNNYNIHSSLEILIMAICMILVITDYFLNPVVCRLIIKIFCYKIYRILPRQMYVHLVEIIGRLRI